jgi:hypothetical protein
MAPPMYLEVIICQLTTTDMNPLATIGTRPVTIRPMTVLFYSQLDQEAFEVHDLNLPGRQE